MARVANWLFVASLPLVFLTGTICCALNSTRMYEYGFDKYHVSEVTGIDRAQLTLVAGRLVDYFNSRVESPQMAVLVDGKQSALFHDYELVHLEDVKRLFRVDYAVFAACLAYAVVYALLFLLWKRGPRRALLRAISRGCLITLGLLAVAGLSGLVAFDWLFVQFHLISFDNPYWMLDPSTDYLIMLFPGGFWEDAVLLSGLAVAGEAALLWGVARALQRAPGVERRLGAGTG